MNYNPLFPLGYQPYNQSQNNTRIYVQGEAGAKSYLIAPNSTVYLWDTESQTFYIKSADASGIPSMRVFDYTERGIEQAQQIDYATKDDIETLRKELDKLKGAKK